MSTLDDTCVIKRAGKERAERVKKEAAELLKEIPGQAGNDDRKVDNDDDKVLNDGMAGWTNHLKDMCDRYAQEGISPGGAADMLALTIFTDSIL